MRAKFDWRRLHSASAERGDNWEWRAELTRLVLAEPEVREDGRRVAQNNLLALSWILGYTLIDEHVHREALEFFPIKNANLTLDEWLTESNATYTRVGELLLPRGVFKTTINIANCIQMLICWPANIAILVMCGRSDLAHDCVGQVGSFFFKPARAHPTLFQALWPELCVEKKIFPEEGFTTAVRQTDPAIIEPAIWGESIESGTSGYHPNILISDDLHNNRNSRTFEGRSHITKKYKLAKKVLLPTGSEIRIGTIYGTGDMYCDSVLNSRPGTVRRLIKPALRLKSGERLDLNDFPDEDEIDLMFPTILTYDFLRAEFEADVGTFFNQYMLDEYGANEVVFTQAQMLSIMVPEENIPMEGETIIYWRFPCQLKGWMTAACAVGQLHRNRCFIVDAMEGEYKPSVLAKLIVTTARKYQVHTVHVEDSPGAVMMTSAIANYALTTGWRLSIEWKRKYDDDEEQEGENAGERDLRIRNMEAVLSTARLFINSKIRQMKKLMVEFTQYGAIPENALPDVISRVSDHLPQSIAAEEFGEEAKAWEQAKERDWYNLVYGRGQYAPPEPEPEEVEPEQSFEEQQLTEQGLEIWIPGIER
jgi:hypothetical protein